MNALQGSGRWFDELYERDSFSSAVTVTETHLVLGAAVGMYFHGTAVAYLEHRARFRAPARTARRDPDRGR
jgi:hypothetical protein